MLTRKQKKEVIKDATKGLYPKWIVERHPELDLDPTEVRTFLIGNGLLSARQSLAFSYAISYLRMYLGYNKNATDEELIKELRDQGYTDPSIWEIRDSGYANRTPGKKEKDPNSRWIIQFSYHDIINYAREEGETDPEFSKWLKKIEADFYLSSNVTTPPFEVEKDAILSDLAYKNKACEEIAGMYEASDKNVPGWLLYYLVQDYERTVSGQALNRIALAQVTSESNALHKQARLDLDYFGLFSKFNFTPHAGQKAFFEIYFDPTKNARFNVLLAGRRFGKTVSCGFLSACELMQPNATVCVIAPNYRNAEIIFSHVLGIFQEQLGIEPTEKNSREKRIKLSNGSVLTVVSAENAKSILGFEPSLTIFEEAANIPGGKKIFEEYIRPATSTATSDLGAGKGRVVFISTPVYGSYLEEYYYRGLTKDGQKAGWRSWKFPSDVNPIVLQSGDMDEARRTIGQPGGMSQDAFAREYLAEWAAPEGTVFEEFSVETHLMSKEDYLERSKDEKVEYVMGIDPGFTHPWAVVIAAYLPSRDEWWILYSYKVKKKPATYHNDRIFEILDELGLQFEQIENIFYDYAAPQAIADLQAANDQWWANLAVKSVDSGRNYIKELLSFNKLFLIEENCSELVKEFMDLSFKETRNGDVRIDKVKDDCLDALRYAVYSYAISVLGGSSFENSQKSQRLDSEFSFI